MSAKIKREFLVAVPGHPDWYQALTEQQAASSSLVEKPFKFKSPLMNAFSLSAYYVTDALKQVLPNSPAIRVEMAEATAAQILKQSGLVSIAISHCEDAELNARARNLKLSVGKRLYNEHSERAYYKLMNNLEFLRELPHESYKHFPATEIANTQTAYALENVLNDKTKKLADKQSSFANIFRTQAADNILIPFFKETNANFDIPDMLMRHWDEIATSPKGKTYNSFTIGENKEATYIRRDFIDKKTAQPS